MFWGSIFFYSNDAPEVLVGGGVLSYSKMNVDN